jgi:hypothetical protein
LAQFQDVQINNPFFAMLVVKPLFNHRVLFSTTASLLLYQASHTSPIPSGGSIALQS